MESGFLDAFHLRPDSVFSVVLLISIFLFVTAEVFWVFKKTVSPDSLKVPNQHFEMIWSFIPAVVLLLLTLVYQKIALHAHGM